MEKRWNSLSQDKTTYILNAIHGKRLTDSASPPATWNVDLGSDVLAGQFKYSIWRQIDLTVVKFRASLVSSGFWNGRSANGYYVQWRRKT